MTPNAPLPEPIKVAICDDHELIHVGVKSVLQNEMDIRIVAEGRCGDDVQQILVTHKPDILLLDLDMPQHEGSERPKFKVIRTLADLGPKSSSRIIILSQKDSPTLLKLLINSGVRGFIHKEDVYGSTRNLAHAIRFVNRTQRGYFSKKIATKLAEIDIVAFPLLTQRRVEILQAVVDNSHLKVHELATVLGVAQSTLSNTLRSIYEALDATDLKDAIIKAQRLGLIALTDQDSLHGENV